MIYIKELLPNPAGDETQTEWVRLINTSEESIPVLNWYLKDESGKTFNLSTIGKVAPHEVIELNRKATGIALNNNGDTLYLYNSNDEKIDELGYQGSIVEGEKVVADQFIEQPPPRENNLQATALESGFLNQSSIFPALLVGVAIALSAALIVFILTSRGDER